MASPKFKIYTLGCKVNQYDSTSLKNDLIKVGFILSEKNAEIAIINTCSVTKSALKKDRQIFTKAKKENPKAKIVLAGCFPRVYKKEARALGADLIWDKNDYKKLVRKLSVDRRTTNKNSCEEINRNKNDRSRYFIKVQDGCEQFCSYCVIPYARGPIKSRPAREVTREVELATKSGYGEVILSGIHLGLYGKDFRKEKTNLVGLIKKLLAIKNLERIRLSSIEITEVTDELIGLFKKNKKLCRHLHIPLQGGSDHILKRMNRPYTTKYFLERIGKIRKAMPDIAITTDVIVGFPGESEKDFTKTIALIKKIKFAKLHVFPFSAHERTMAAKMDKQVNEETKMKRASKLRLLSDKLEADFKRGFKNKTLTLIIDGKSRGEDMIGMSEYFFQARFKRKDIIGRALSKTGEVVRVKKWE